MFYYYIFVIYMILKSYDSMGDLPLSSNYSVVIALSLTMNYIFYHKGIT